MGFLGKLLNIVKGRSVGLRLHYQKIECLMEVSES